MNRPIAVIAGDIHYRLDTLRLADAGTRMAIAKANELEVPFISNGDMHDQKALLRGECVNAILATIKLCKIRPYINIGNHSRINERSPEHSLNFLSPYATIIDEPAFIPELESYIIPYAHDPEALKSYLKTLPERSRLIMHQGITDSNSGEYFHDKSAIPKECLKDFRTLLSHYHARQDIKCGRPQRNYVGLASYIGNLYTTTFAEANDPEKGFQILYDDGSLEFVPTNLRKHRIFELEAQNLLQIEVTNPEDLLWIKISGTREEINRLSRKTVGEKLGLSSLPFKLDLIPSETSSFEAAKELPQEAQIDSLIDSLQNTSEERKIRLKNLWKTLNEDT